MYAVCQRQRSAKLHRGGVAKMRALMKHKAKEKVGTSSTNTAAFDVSHCHLAQNQHPAGIVGLFKNKGAYSVVAPFMDIVPRFLAHNLWVA